MSIMEFPSTSTMTPPPARSTKTGIAIPSEAETALARRAINSLDFGPGISVRKWRTCGRLLPVRRVPSSSALMRVRIEQVSI